MGRTYKRRVTKRRVTKRRVTKRRDTKRINNNKRNTNKRNTNKRNTKNRITNKVNDKSDINKFIRKKLPGYKLIKILNSKQTGGGISTDYHQGTKLGEGTFGTVYLARDKSTGEKVVIKEFIEDDETVALDEAKQEYFFGQIVNALTINNTVYQNQLDQDKALSHNMIVLYTEQDRSLTKGELCNNYLALYKEVFDREKHKLVIFNVDTNSPDYMDNQRCPGYSFRPGRPTFKKDLLGYGGYKLFEGLRKGVKKKAIRLPPRVAGKDYRGVKVPTYINRYGTKIVMEYIEGKTLNKYLRESIVSGHLINEYKLRAVIKQVLQFISMVNNSYLSHNDYNFNNIMVDDRDPDNVIVTVIDYGLMSVTGYNHFPNTHPVPGKYYGPNPTLSHAGAHPHYTPMGYDQRDRYGHNPAFIYNNTDIYVFFDWFLLTLNIILKVDLSATEVIDEILSNYRNESLANYFQHWSPEFKGFMKLALTYDDVVKAGPYGSTPADTLLQHPWILKGDDKEVFESKLKIVDYLNTHGEWLGWQAKKSSAGKTYYFDLSNKTKGYAGTWIVPTEPSMSEKDWEKYKTDRSARGQEADEGSDDGAGAGFGTSRHRARVNVGVDDSTPTEVQVFGDTPEAEKEAAAKKEADAKKDAAAKKEADAKKDAAAKEDLKTKYTELNEKGELIINVIDGELNNTMPQETYDEARQNAERGNWISTTDKPIYVKVTGNVFGIDRFDYGYVLGKDINGKYVLLFNTGIKKEDLKFLEDKRLYKVIPNQYIHPNLPALYKTYAEC
jgi:serine/threonine protein kinase